MTIMKKRIVVTQKDINLGVCTNPLACPVSLALTRGFKKPTSVTAWDWRFQENRIYFVNSIPVRTFIRNFDAGKEVKPFQFTVKI